MRFITWLLVKQGIMNEQEYDELLVSFVYNSEAIEGCKATLEDVKSIIHKGYSKNYNSYGEISAKQIMTHYNIANKIMRLNGYLHIADIKLFHGMLFAELILDAGNFRTHNAMILGSDAVLAKPRYIYGLMCTFLDEYNNHHYSAALRTLFQVGLRHYKFEKIHPFSDGNGRIGRLIMLHDLYRNGLELNESTMITMKKQQEYYSALADGEGAFARWYSGTT